MFGKCVGGVLFVSVRFKPGEKHSLVCGGRP